MRPFLVIAGLASLLLACTGDGEAPAAVPSPTPTPATEAATPTPTTEAATPSPTPSPTTDAAAPSPTATPTAGVPPEPTVDVSTVIIPTVPYPTSTARPPIVHPQQGELDQAARRTLAIRRLYPTQAIDREFITRQELNENLQELLDDERDEMLLEQKLYRVLSLIDPGEDLFTIVTNILNENILGYYHLEEEKLYVVQDQAELTPLNIVTYAHETTHALQQQHYDIYATRQELGSNADRYAAFDALVEGDASIVEALYMLQYLTDEERQQYAEESRAVAGDSLRTAPYVVRRLFVFPYLEGFSFVRSLLGMDGWDSVDEAYAAPPTSTEQILHFDRYLKREAPVEVQLPDLASALGEGWSELDRNSFGEFLVRTYLEVEVTQEKASVASTGWGGDAYSLLEGPGGALALVVQTTWDSDDDAGEFFEAFMEHASSRTGLTWETLDDAGHRGRMAAEGQTASAVLEGLDVLLVFAPDAAVADVLTAAVEEARGDG